MSDLGHALTASLLFVSLSSATALALLGLHHLWRPLHPVVSLVGIAVIAGLPTALLGSQPWLALPPLAAGAALLLATRRLMAGFSVPGRLLLLTQLGLLLVASAWGLWFITSIPVSAVTRALMLVGLPLLAITAMPSAVQALEQWEVLCRVRWSRPRTPLPPKSGAASRKVSVHVPTYAEPPEVVIGTLNALAQLRYSNYEVLVIDNNTKDRRLWQPVEEHCRRLGPRFRFFHLDDWPGAKAGALNFALTETAPDAELIAVVDADYHADPGFLAELVGYFDDPKLGFIQTPHDYREWESSTYLRMCYWEYQYFFQTKQVSRNERDAAIIVGTMCIVRRAAVEQAGGWAEWCVTEDSELAVRIHALGYSSIYVPTTFGRGLIPDTFAGYKKQRFRWTYGPVQTLKHHLPLFKRHLPLALTRRSTRPSFTFAQWVHHLNAGLEGPQTGLGFLLLPLGGLLMASIVAHGETIPVPPVLWLTATVALVMTYASTWLIYRAVLGCSVRETIGAVISSKALSHTVTMASLWGIITKSIPWRRTSKFKASSLGISAIRSAQTELALGLLMLGGACVAALALRPQGLVVMLLVGALLRSLDYFAAPLAAWLSERHVQAQELQLTAQPA